MKEFVSDWANRTVILIGSVVLFLIGPHRFYRLTEAGVPALSPLARKLCGCRHLLKLTDDFKEQIDGHKRDRITPRMLALYSGDSLAGWADQEYKPGQGKPLLQQQRGLAVPLIEKEIESFRARTGKEPRVLEIGTGNGDIMAYLASRYPNVQFVGLDLSIANAAKNHVAKNLKFIKGYCLDVLTDSPDAVKADIVFGSSTFCAQTAKEFRRCLELLSSNGVSGFVFNEPVTNGMPQANNSQPLSRHMEHYMWNHNYAGHLRSAGYHVSHFERAKFSYPNQPVRNVILVAGNR